MRVLVTGLCGFTGKYVKQELEAHGHQVMGLDADLTDADALNKEIQIKQPEAVIHLAGITFVGHGDVNDFYRVNVIGTRNLLVALDQFVPDVKSILLASSAQVYGCQTHDTLHEQDELIPNNDYSISKMAMEKMSLLWQDRLPLFIVRPFNYTGQGQSNSFLIPKIVEHFKQKAASIALGNLDVYREFNDVRMVAEIYRKLLEIDPIGKIINICSGTVHSLQNIIDQCQQLTQHEIEITVNPKFVRANEMKTLKGSNTLLASLVSDYKNKPLEQTLEWMLTDNT
ncbi:MAG: NAD-dependent epimerase/dehydratase family protein [Coxiellaceae bacterium]|nr:NAD-dependent epimerase/dehydratase family protein [Coxiellaceae bacterium]